MSFGLLTIDDFFFCTKVNTELIVLCDSSLDSNRNVCNPPLPPTKKGKRVIIIAISVVVSVMTFGALALVYLIWRRKTKSNGAYVFFFLSLFDLY